MTYAINPHNSWLALERAVEEQTGEREAGLVRQVRDHMEAEIQGRLEPLLATLADEPVYHLWNQAGPMVLRGRDTIAGLYTDMFETGAEQFEFVIEKVIANTHNVVTEGHLKQVYTGTALIEQGMTQVGEQTVEEGQFWLSDAQLIVVWPATEDGRLVGEDVYYGEDPMNTLELISPDQLPPYFRIV